MATSVSMMHQRYYSTVHMRNGNLYKGVPRSKPRHFQSSMEREANLQQGVGETLKEAALINIVAAVNEDQTSAGNDKLDVTAAPGSAIDSLSNTMAVISNLMNSRKRTVSIPRTSNVLGSFYFAKNTIQKKPVYYKHSDDEEVAWKEQQKAILKGMHHDREDSNVRSSQPYTREKSRAAKEVVIKSLPTTPHTIEYNLMHNTNQTTPVAKRPTTKGKERDIESRSSIRRLGTLKGSEPRKVHKIAKCDAIDLSETQNNANVHEIITILNTADKNKSENRKQTNESKVKRTKSLPPMFTPKSASSRSAASTPATKSINSAIRGRHLSRSITQRTPDSLYKRTMNMPNGYGFEKLAICNGINQHPDISNPVAHDSRKLPRTSKPLFSGIVTQKSNWKQKPSKPPLFSHTFRGMSNQTEMETEALLTGKRVFFTETDDFHDAVKSAMNGTTDTHYEEVVYSVTPTGKTSSMSGTFGDGDRGDKHVQFVRRRYLSDSSDETFPDEKMDEDGGDDATFQDTRILHAPVSTSVSYPPIMASQLLRIQQKIIPANIKTEAPSFQPYFSTSSSITLQTLQRQRTDLSSQRSKSFVRADDEMDDIEIEVKEHATEDKHHMIDEPELVLPEENDEENVYNTGEFTEMHEFARSPIGRDLSTAASKTHPETPDRKSRDHFYKLVKAVDTHSYSEFEHKKLRRLPAGVCGKALDNQTTEFVKVKL